MELALLIIGVGVVGVTLLVAVLVVRSNARAARQLLAQEQSATDELAELTRTAGSALVRADERARLADDELGFAIADFGEAATAEFAVAIQRARQRLGEAFQLNQQLSDHVPDTNAQRREWTERIISLCQSAETVIADQQSAVTARRAAVRRAPSDIEKVRADIRRVRELLPDARITVVRLAVRYTDGALKPIAENPDQAEQLLEFAERTAAVAESRLAASRISEADTVVHAGTETVRRAEALLAAVGAFEVEALQAESTLAAMAAESRAELAEARSIPEPERRGQIDSAIAALDRELVAVPIPGSRLDPVGSLSTLRGANSALDDAVADRADRAERSERLRTQLMTAINDAERQIAAARELISDYRAPIGPDARTRLAEAERELAAMTDELQPEPAIARARRAASLAADAAACARADVERARRNDGADPRHGNYGRGGQNLLGGILGGLVIGGLLDDLGDLDDLFD
ncbi:hypothetical protein ABIB15_000059 [Marisediminicola sp. UYEF4]|uniref:hypothetical protein n=1 Tax=Marisediminicola sp. UYEF4 TaxID=1756384 RepID=UPI003393785F